MNKAESISQKRTVIKISGMNCAGCVTAIQQHVSKIPGVQKCDVNLGSEKAVMQYDPAKVDLSILEKAVKDAGYRVVYEKLKLEVSGISDASDAQTLENILTKKEGIRFSSVNFGTGQIFLEYNPALLSLSEIRKQITDYGFQILNEDISDSVEDIEAKKTRHLFFLGVIFSIPVILSGEISRDFLSFPFAGITEGAYISFACASIVQFGIGWRFYVGAFKITKMKSANMDTLIVLGTTTAYIFSAVNTFPIPIWENIHYMASVMIITFILLGKYLENKTKKKASSVIRKMLELQPKTARIKKGENQEETPIDLIQQGDTVIVKPGEKIPVDSTVIEGTSAVDESLVTGESFPVTKKRGDKVIGGTINREGVLVLKTLRVGRDTFLSQVVNLVEEAMGQKPPMQRLVDKIAGYFSFIVIAVAITSFFSWYFFGAPGLIMSAIIPTVAILVVACPCALGLATPTAVMVGMGKATQNGVIFKGGQGLELLGKIQTIVFDKTGTLTQGKPEISDIIPVGNKIDSTELLRITAIAEKNSEHPLSKAVIKKAKQEEIKISDPDKFEAIPGGGVRITTENNSVIVGNLSLFEREKIDFKETTHEITKLQEQGKTVSIIVVNNKVQGIISFLDMPKQDSKETVSMLKKMGIEVIMLTGDNEKTAKTIGQKLGIDKIISNVLPSQKIEEIKKIQNQGKKVAMVGDGINDAPAITQSDVGIAIGRGTDIALESGMIILVRDSLKDIVTAIEISKKTINKIKQNLFYSFIYNTVLIPVAGVGLLYPALAGLAMAASSISVVSSSLLLKRWVPPSKMK